MYGEQEAKRLHIIRIHIRPLAVGPTLPSLGANFFFQLQGKSIEIIFGIKGAFTKGGSDKGAQASSLTLAAFKTLALVSTDCSDAYQRAERAAFFVTQCRQFIEHWLSRLISPTNAYPDNYSSKSLHYSGNFSPGGFVFRTPINILKNSLVPHLVPGGG